MPTDDLYLNTVVVIEKKWNESDEAYSPSLDSDRAIYVEKKGGKFSTYEASVGGPDEEIKIPEKSYYYEVKLRGDFSYLNSNGKFVVFTIDNFKTFINKFFESKSLLNKAQRKDYWKWSAQDIYYDIIRYHKEKDFEKNSSEYGISIKEITDDVSKYVPRNNKLIWRDFADNLSEKAISAELTLSINKVIETKTMQNLFDYFDDCYEYLKKNPSNLRRFYVFFVKNLCVEDLVNEEDKFVLKSMIRSKYAKNNFKALIDNEEFLRFDYPRGDNSENYILPAWDDNSRDGTEVFVGGRWKRRDLWEDLKLFKENLKRFNA